MSTDILGVSRSFGIFDLLHSSDRIAAYIIFASSPYVTKQLIIRTLLVPHEVDLLIATESPPASTSTSPCVQEYLFNALDYDLFTVIYFRAISKGTSVHDEFIKLVSSSAASWLNTLKPSDDDTDHPIRQDTDHVTRIKMANSITADQSLPDITLWHIAELVDPDLRAMCGLHSIDSLQNAPPDVDLAFRRRQLILRLLAQHFASSCHNSVHTYLSTDVDNISLGAPIEVEHALRQHFREFPASNLHYDTLAPLLPPGTYVPRDPAFDQFLYRVQARTVSSGMHTPPRPRSQLWMYRPRQLPLSPQSYNMDETMPLSTPSPDTVQQSAQSIAISDRAATHALDMETRFREMEARLRTLEDGRIMAEIQLQIAGNHIRDLDTEVGLLRMAMRVPIAHVSATDVPAQQQSPRQQPCRPTTSSTPYPHIPFVASSSTVSSTTVSQHSCSTTSADDSPNTLPSSFPIPRVNTPAVSHTRDNPRPDTTTPMVQHSSSSTQATTEPRTPPSSAPPHASTTAPSSRPSVRTVSRRLRPVYSTVVARALHDQNDEHHHERFDITCNDRIDLTTVTGIAPFTGDTGQSFREWISIFTSRSRSVMPRQRMVWLTQHLRGSALAVWSNLPEETRHNYFLTVAALIAYYADPMTPAQAYMQFASSTLGPNESIEEFAQRLYTLAFRAEPRLPPQRRNSAIMRQLQRCLPPSVQQELRRRFLNTSVTLPQFISSAAEICASTRSFATTTTLNMPRFVVPTVPRPSTPAPTVCISSSDADTVASMNIPETNIDHNDTVTVTPTLPTRTVASRFSRTPHQVTTTGTWSNGKWYPHTRPATYNYSTDCRNCFQTGHFAINCVLPCHFCGQPTHSTYSCRQYVRTPSPSPTRAPTTPSASATASTTRTPTTAAVAHADSGPENTPSTAHEQ